MGLQNWAASEKWSGRRVKLRGSSDGSSFGAAGVDINSPSGGEDTYAVSLPCARRDYLLSSPLGLFMTSAARALARV